MPLRLCCQVSLWASCSWEMLVNLAKLPREREPLLVLSFPDLRTPSLPSHVILSSASVCHLRLAAGVHPLVSFPSP